jgi:hypothetical protein
MPDFVNIINTALVNRIMRCLGIKQVRPSGPLIMA